MSSIKEIGKFECRADKQIIFCKLPCRHARLLFSEPVYKLGHTEKRKKPITAHKTGEKMRNNCQNMKHVIDMANKSLNRAGAMSKRTYKKTIQFKLKMQKLWLCHDPVFGGRGGDCA